MNAETPWLWLAMSAFWAGWLWWAIRTGKANTGLWPEIRRSSRPILYWWYIAIYGTWALGCLAAAVDKLIRANGR